MENQSWGSLRAVLGSREALLRIPWASLVSLELSWALLRLSEDCLGPLGSLLKLLEPSWDCIGLHWGSVAKSLYKPFERYVTNFGNTFEQPVKSLQTTRKTCVDI